LLGAVDANDANKQVPAAVEVLVELPIPLVVPVAETSWMYAKEDVPAAPTQILLPFPSTFVHTTVDGRATAEIAPVAEPQNTIEFAAATAVQALEAYVYCVVPA